MSGSELQDLLFALKQLAFNLTREDTAFVSGGFVFVLSVLFIVRWFWQKSLDAGLASVKWTGVKTGRGLRGAWRWWTTGAHLVEKYADVKAPELKEQPMHELAKKVLTALNCNDGLEQYEDEKGLKWVTNAWLRVCLPNRFIVQMWDNEYDTWIDATKLFRDSEAKTIGIAAEKVYVRVKNKDDEVLRCKLADTKMESCEESCSDADFAAWNALERRVDDVGKELAERERGTHAVSVDLAETKKALKTLFNEVTHDRQLLHEARDQIRKLHTSKDAEQVAVNDLRASMLAQSQSIADVVKQVTALCEKFAWTDANKWAWPSTVGLIEGLRSIKTDADIVKGEP